MATRSDVVMSMLIGTNNFGLAWHTSAEVAAGVNANVDVRRESFEPRVTAM